MSLAILLGSFDPIHRGHQRMVAEMRGRADVVRLLVPAAHFEKRIRFPRNATLDQRVEMIRAVYPDGSGVEARVSHEVLFVSLARRHPEALFGMGRETLGKLLRSQRYFERLGLPWGDGEARVLSRLIPRVVVFDRADGISSTRVRRVAGDLHAASASAAEWERGLGPLVAPPVTAYVRALGLYSGRGAVGS